MAHVSDDPEALLLEPTAQLSEPPNSLTPDCAIETQLVFFLIFDRERMLDSSLELSDGEALVVGGDAPWALILDDDEEDEEDEDED